MLHQLCKDKKVDSKYFPIAFSIHEYSTIQAPLDNTANIKIYAINKDEAGNTFDKISEYISRNEGKINVTKIDLELSYKELSKYFKRIGIFAIQKGLENIIEEMIEE